MTRPTINVKWKKIHPDFKVPEHATPGSAAVDMIACIDDPVQIMPGQRALISLGCAVQIPEGWEMQLRPRSGLAIKEGITVLNSPGTVDSDYTGEVKVIVINHSDQWFTIRPLDRICQAAFRQVPIVKSQLVTELDSTERGSGGFGSTGVSSDKK